jgi:hypothetical protein
MTYNLRRRRTSTRTFKKKRAPSRYNTAANYKAFAAKNPKRKFTRRRRSSTASLRATPGKIGDGHYLTAFSYGKKMVPRRILDTIKQSGWNIKGYNTSVALHVTKGVQVLSAGTFGVFTPADVATYCPPSGTSAGKVYAHQCTQKIFGTNQTNANVFVEIYDCVARHDIGRLASASYPVYTPETAWGMNGTPTTIGADPFQNPNFVQNWKVKKITRYCLTEGQTFEHIKHVRPNKEFQESYFDYAEDAIAGSPTNAGTLRNVTEYSMVVFFSQAGDASNDTVSTVAGKLDLIGSWQYSSTTIATGFAGPTFTNNLGIAADHIMSTDLGVSVAEAEA